MGYAARRDPFPSHLPQDYPLLLGEILAFGDFDTRGILRIRTEKRDPDRSIELQESTLRLLQDLRDPNDGAGTNLPEPSHPPSPRPHPPLLAVRPRADLTSHHESFSSAGRVVTRICGLWQTGSLSPGMPPTVGKGLLCSRAHRCPRGSRPAQGIGQREAGGTYNPARNPASGPYAHDPSRKQ
jgi:hypothetical protein